MNTPAHLVTVSALAALYLCSGCALVPFPVSRTLPDPIKQVKVIREGTGQPITNAEIVMHAERFENWMRSFPPHYRDGFTPAPQTSIVIPLHRVASGRLKPEAQRVRRFIRPWGVGPLGMTIHEDFTVTISARAEGYTSVTATYSPAGPMNPIRRATESDAQFLAPEFKPDGTLIVLLRAQNAEPSGATNVSQPVRWQTNSTSSEAGSPR